MVARARVRIGAGGPYYWMADDMDKPQSWIIDGVGPIPPQIAARLTAPGEAQRLATFGKVRQILRHDFGPGVGVQQVVVCEKWAGVLLPYPPPNDVQGVLLGQVGVVLGGK